MRVPTLRVRDRQPAHELRKITIATVQNFAFGGVNTCLFIKALND